jgi:hypothetical protein
VFREPEGVILGELTPILRRDVTVLRPQRPSDAGARALGLSLANSGYLNGRLPSTLLARTESGCVMYVPAAVAYDAMYAAAARDGFRLEHSGCYRTYEQQVLLRETRCAQNRCEFAAVPGTSQHGWGLAVDFRIGDRTLGFDDELFAWLKANAGRFGYVHPRWARRGGNLEEPWHWEFGVMGAPPASPASPANPGGDEAAPDATGGEPSSEEGQEEEPPLSEEQGKLDSLVPDVEQTDEDPAQGPDPGAETTETTETTATTETSTTIGGPTP